MKIGLQIRLGLTAMVLALLAACGGGGSGAAPTAGACAGSGCGGTATAPAPDTGSAMVTLTDAPGSFLSYVVKVVSVQFKRADGTAVETLPAATPVDFAKLVDLSEVLSLQQIPAGTYVSASVTLDFAGASLVVDNGAAGLTVPAGNILNGVTGNPLLAPNSQVTLNLTLPSGAPLVISKAALEHLLLDFNLVASNKLSPAVPTASTAPGSLTVTVNPALAVTTVPDAAKGLRLRGTLASVTNTATDTSYTVKVRPFFNADGTTGDAVVKVTSATTYTVNGTAYTGTPGLAALAALPVGTLTLGTGAFDKATKTFTASSVVAGTSLAGTSVSGSSVDSLEGTVIARSGNTVTLTRSLAVEAGKTGVSFVSQATVALAAGTTVTKDGKAATLADVSVGQHAHFMGSFAAASGTTRTLDASKGSVRLDVTPLWGKFVSNAAGVVTLDLQMLDALPVSTFNFAGTGASAALDAKPGSYKVAVPSGLAVGTPAAGAVLRFFGYVAPFGGSGANFQANTLVSYENTQALFSIEWDKPGAKSPFGANLLATGLSLSSATLATADEVALIIGPQKIPLSSLTNGLTLVPGSLAGPNTYVLAHRTSRKAETLTNLATLVPALVTSLAANATVMGVEGAGSFDAATGKLTLTRLTISLSD